MKTSSLPLLHRLTLLALLVACTWTPPASAQLPDNAAPATAQPRPELAYTLITADQLRVIVYQEDDLTAVNRVDAGGNINLQLVGPVQVHGLSVSEAQTAIERAYREGRFLRNPQVTITIEQYAPREVSIQGEVVNPNRYSLPIETTWTIVDLVTKAGGLKDTAKGNAVIVTRFALDGKKQTLGPFDVASLIRGKGKSDSDANALILLPGDIVYVPMRII